MIYHCLACMLWFWLFFNLHYVSLCFIVTAQFMNISCHQFDSTLWSSSLSSLKVFVISSSALDISWWSMCISYVSTGFLYISFYTLSDAWYIWARLPQRGIAMKILSTWEWKLTSYLPQSRSLKCIRLSMFSTVRFVNISFVIFKR